MADSKVLVIADELVARIEDIVADNVPTTTATEVTRTYYMRFTDETVGRKVYVVPQSDETNTGTGATRGRDARKYTYLVAVAERIDSGMESIDEREVYIDEIVDFVTVLRDTLDNPRDFSLQVHDTNLVPVTTATREVYDVNLLNMKSVFYSEFEITFRED